MLRVEQDLVLAIEPECYRRWLEDARQAATAALMERAHSPEAAARLEPTRKSSGDIAVVNLSGFITQKPSLMSLLFGGTSAEWFAATVVGAMADPAVSAVVMNVDSPGGTVFGVPEAAAAIRASRGSKPLKAVANPLAASAGYYLASQADEVVMSPSAMVGSIGVKVVHVDESAALKAAGLTVTEITYGRRKVEESSAGPLSEEALASIQARVDYYGAMFESDVAKGRRTSVATVRAKYGEGAMFTANGAKAAGLVDRVATLDEVLGELTSGARRAGPRAELAAECDPVEIAVRAALAGLSTGKER
jgi:signal peptide peptidase SppA